MENYLMNYDTETGEIKGFYLKSIHGENIPSPTIEITPEKHDFYMQNNGKYRLNSKTLEDELIPEPAPTVQPPNVESRVKALEDAMLASL